MNLLKTAPSWAEAFLMFFFSPRTVLNLYRFELNKNLPCHLNIYQAITYKSLFRVMVFIVDCTNDMIIVNLDMILLEKIIDVGSKFLFASLAEHYKNGSSALNILLKNLKFLLCKRALWTSKYYEAIFKDRLVDLLFVQI